MNELREKIARIVYDYRYIAPERVESVDYEADKILALVDAQPSGLIAVKTCIYIYHNENCCGGTGTITRDLSVKEALEDYKETIKLHKEACGLDWPLGRNNCERVQVKEK